MRQVTDVKPVIRVAPTRYSFCGAWSPRDAQRMAIEIETLIQRHVVPSFDEFSVDRLDIDVEFDETAECDHCGAAWVTDDRYFNGGCCELDRDPKADSIDGLYAWLKAELSTQGPDFFSPTHPAYVELCKRGWDMVRYTIDKLRNYPAEELPVGCFVVLDRFYRDAAHYAEPVGRHPVDPTERDSAKIAQAWVDWYDSRVPRKK